MSEQPLVPKLSSDRPIRLFSEDVLGRGEFAVALANAFIQWRGDESLVVALYGPWGSGKSSVKNMVLDLIRRHEPQPAVVEFNPWAWSGQDRLLSAFFEEIGIAIGKKSEAKDAEMLASKWRKYAARLSFAGTVLTAIKTGTQVIGVPVVPAVLEGLAGGAEKASGVAEAAEKALESAGKEEPLNELKKSLSESLHDLSAPLLVVMDDVDRLTKEEIRLLFQLIKINADFPRVVYFLLFDRTVIEESLEGIGGATGRDYMEKIVQAGFDLPRLNRSDLDTMFFHGLDSLLQFAGAGRTFDRDRWGNLFAYGLRPILSTPRDVQRFLSAFSFAVGLFHKQETLEVNVIDLIGIEVLRIFEPDLYHQLPEYEGLLLGNSGHWSMRDERPDRRNEIEVLLSVADEDRREAVRAILRELFPAVDWTLKGYGYGQGFEQGWLRELRICHRDIFDRYFALTVPKGDVPQSLIDGLLMIAGDRTSLCEALKALGQEGRLVGVLKRLEAFTPVLDLGNTVPFVTALMDIGDSLPERGEGLFEIGPDMTAYRLIYQLLKRQEDGKLRGQMLLQAVEDTEGLFLPLQVVSLDEQRREKDQQSHNPPLLDKEGTARAKQLCITKIESAAAVGKLAGPKLPYYLWRWRGFAGDGPPRQFASSLTATPIGALQFLRQVVEEVRSQSMDRVTVHIRWVLNLDNLEQFVDLSHLKTVLEPLIGEAVPADWMAVAAEFEREIQAFRDALVRRARGLPEDGFGSGEGTE